MSTPRVSFLIGGVQKAGTTALGEFLALHPQVALPARKEAHIFDAPDFDDAADSAAVDRRYASQFADAVPSALYGDATPIYLFLPQAIQRIARYRPSMRWIILLRHPVARALSHYHMERGRGTETWPLWPALMLERWRLRGHGDDLSWQSPLRLHSYRARGDYASQLDRLYAHFPGDQVLVLDSAQLRHQPDQALARVYAHLGLSGTPQLPAMQTVFAGRYPRLPQNSWRTRMLTALFRHELATLKNRYDIDLAFGP